MLFTALTPARTYASYLINYVPLGYLISKSGRRLSTSRHHRIEFIPRHLPITVSVDHANHFIYFFIGNLLPDIDQYMSDFSGSDEVIMV